jgi:hypothetical protein
LGRRRELKAGSHPGSFDTYGGFKLLTGQHSVDAAPRPAGRADEQLDVGTEGAPQAFGLACELLLYPNPLNRRSPSFSKGTTSATAASPASMLSRARSS